MGVSFATVTETGRNLVGTVRQFSANGTPGDYWNVTTGVFASSVNFSDREIEMTEGGTNDLGLYTGGTGTLGSYSGYILKQIHDSDDSNRVVGVGISWFEDGDETRPALDSDVDGVPAATFSYINSNGGVTASNMRGTDSALLAASYTAPDNANIVAAATDASTAAAQATTAATQATNAATDAATLEGRLTGARATNLDNLDAAITTRSSHAPADVQSYLVSNQIPVSNMRGTDNALLAASYTAPDNTGITNTLTQATNAATDSATAISRLTATRAGYLDNLSAGAVATQASVDGITNTTRTKLIVSPQAQIPTSGTETYVVDFFLYDTNGNMEGPDSTPTFTAANELGTDRSVNLSAPTNPTTGHYRATYSVASTHAEERIVIQVSATEGGNTLITTAMTDVVSIVAGTGFNSSDRTELNAIFAKLPSKAYLTGTAASDGDIDLDTVDGDKTAFMANVGSLATAASIASIPADVQSYLVSNQIPVSNMRGTDNAFLAANWTAPNNTGITDTLSQATTAATQSTNAATDAAAAKTAAQSIDGKVTVGRAANLDNLDATVSSRSTFDDTTDGVILAAGHGLATAADQTSIKAKTDNLPAAPAATSDIPTASQVATQVDSTLTTSHGAGAWNTASDATLAKQDAILAIVGGITPTPPSAARVGKQRTWVIEDGSEDDRAPQIVSLTSGASVTLAMDFEKALNPDTAISTVNTATDISGNGLVPTNLLPSQDRLKAHFDVTGLTSGLRYEIKVTVTTTDAQTLTGRGILRAE